MEPTFSVLISAYSRQEYLGAAVDSVLAQTRRSWQLIVVDDASPTPLSVQADPRIELLRLEENRGKAYALNEALTRAKGRFITFLDDDDMWAPHRLEHAEWGHEIGDVVACASRVMGEPSAQGRARGATPVARAASGAELARRELIAPMGALSVRRELCPDFDESFRASQDLEWGIRLMRAAPAVVMVDSADFIWRRHEGPRHGNDQSARILASHRLLQTYASHYDRYPAQKAFRLYRLGVMSLMQGQGRQALGYARRSLTARPSWAAVRLAVRAIGAL